VGSNRSPRRRKGSDVTTAAGPTRRRQTDARGLYQRIPTGYLERQVIWMTEILDLTDIPFSLRQTLECGQTFSWSKTEEEGVQKYFTVRNGGILKVWQEGDRLMYDCLGNRVDPVDVLRLDDPLDEIYRCINKDGFMERAVAVNHGLRIVRDEFFPCLISYITSSQMQIPRILRIQMDIRAKYGQPLELGREYNQFPGPGVLADVPEDELRNLNIGYRAGYVKKTSEMVRDGAVDPENLRSMDYTEAKEKLKVLPGVGDKVADCVLLFSLGFLESFPVDTWVRRIVKQEYREKYSKNYEILSENMRNYFGDYAGYAQEYLFHYGRTCTDLE